MMQPTRLEPHLHESLVIAGRVNNDLQTPSKRGKQAKVYAINIEA